MNLSGRRILVTGASSGLGRETAILLGELNARVILVARDHSRLQETLRQIPGEGHVVAPFDLADSDAIPAWLRTVTAESGPLNGLVHSAGVRHTLPLRVLTAAKFEELMRINLTSAAMLAKAFQQRGCSTAPSALVFLSSVAGFAGSPAISAYSASKAGLIGLTKSLALELAREGIRVNSVAPGFVRTEMWDRQREMSTPEQLQTIEEMHPLGLGAARDVANAVAFLLAETGRWITGSVLVVDGGYSAH